MGRGRAARRGRGTGTLPSAACLTRARMAWAAPGRRATDRSVRPHHYRRRRAEGLIGIRYFVVFLHEDMSQVVLLCLAPVVL